MTAFTDLLANPYAIKHYLIELAPYDPGTAGVVNLYVSDQGFTTGPADSPANTYYEPRIAEALNFSRSIVDQDRVRGRVSADFGVTTLLSGDLDDDNTLDAWAAYNWDGRSITVRLGGADFAYSDYGVIGTFTAEGVDLSSQYLKIRLRSGLYDLDVPIQSERFAGTGGAEGNTDVANQLKPRAYGRVRNIEPVYIGLHDLGDGSLHTFAYHDGAAQGADAVYSNGSALTEVASAPTAGQYADHEASGVFQIGGSTLDTVITADVEGAKDGGGTYVSSAADIMDLIIGDVSSLTLAAGTVSALNTDNSAVVGIWLPDGGNTLDVLSQIANSIGAWFAPNRSGEVEFGRIEAPAASAAESYGEESVLDLERRSAVLPSKAVRLRYRRAWRTQSLVEIAGAVSESRRTFLSRPWREEVSSDASVATAHPLAVEEVFDSLLDTSSDASTEAARLQTLYGEDREVFRVTVKTQPFQRRLGETVEITDTRFGLSAGKKFVVIGLDEVAADNRVTMTLWG